MEAQTQQIADKPKSTIEALLRAIDGFQTKNPGTTDESLGWKAVKDSSIVERLRNGGDCTTRKLDALIRFMHNPKKRG